MALVSPGGAYDVDAGTDCVSRLTTNIPAGGIAFVCILRFGWPAMSIKDDLVADDGAIIIVGRSEKALPVCTSLPFGATIVM